MCNREVDGEIMRSRNDNEETLIFRMTHCSSLDAGPMVESSVF